MKGKKLLLLICIPILLLSACGFLLMRFLFGDVATEEEIVQYVTEHQSEIVSQCETWIENGEKNINKTEFIQEIHYKKKKKAVVFSCYSDGIASASVERGFYYSFDDDVAIPAVDWAPMDQKPEKEGNYIRWCYEPGGDLYMTKKITDHLYFYEASN